MITRKYLTGIFIVLWGSLFTAVAGADYDIFDPLVDVCDLIQKYYATETESQELIAGAINGMLHKLDPYSEFIPADDVNDFQKQTSGSYEGIGVVIDIKDGYLTAVSPIEDSPAYRAGIRPGDIFLEVDGKSTKGWSATRAIGVLTGPAGTSVTLRVLHRDGREENITIARQKINVPTLRGWRRSSFDGRWDYMIDESLGIAYLRITQFNPDTVREMDVVVNQLLAREMKAMVLDLRINPGGILSAAVDIVDRFIDHGIIVSTRGAHSTPRIEYANAQGTWPRFPLVVLIDSGSASASEIVAGSLQDNNRAVIVGTRSWGKGSVQRIFKLPDSGACLKLTTDYYYLPKGRCIHRRDDAEEWGVEPDIEQHLDGEKMPELQKLMNQLILESLSKDVPSDGDKEAVYSESDNTPQQSEAKQQDLLQADEVLRKKLSQKLLDLDDQVRQAVNQCKGLLRTRSTLQSISETITVSP